MPDRIEGYRPYHARECPDRESRTAGRCTCGGLKEPLYDTFDPTEARVAREVPASCPACPECGMRNVHQEQCATGARAARARMIPDGAGGYLEDRELSPQEAQIIATAIRDTMAPAITEMTRQFSALIQALAPAVTTLLANYQRILNRIEAALPPDRCPRCEGSGYADDPTACGDREHCDGRMPCPNGCTAVPL